MNSDLYLRAVLTVIAAALVYLCVVLTPIPAASAQGRVVGARTPGESTGPAEMVVVGWRTPANEPVPVRIVGDVNVANTVRVSGRVEVAQPPDEAMRTVVIGYENRAGFLGRGQYNHGQFVGLDRSDAGLPVTPLPPRP